LTLTPATQGSPNTIAYEGVQHVSKETECLLLFDQTTQTFTLEKLSSSFTFNAKVFANAHPPLPLRQPVVEGEDDEISAEENEDNPFDFRRFLNKKPITKTRAEQRAEKEERRKKALIAAGALSESPGGSDLEKCDSEESGLGLGITCEGHAPTGKGSKFGGHLSSLKTSGMASAGKKQTSAGRGAAIPGPGPVAITTNSEESEADQEDNDEEDDDSDDQQVADRPRPIPMPLKSARQQREDEMEEIVFDSPGIAAKEDEEEISDADDSDDDGPGLPPTSQQLLAPYAKPQHGEEEEEEVEEEEEDDDEDDFDLAVELEQALESEEDPPVASSIPQAEGEIIFEDDDTTTAKPRIGVINKALVPTSLSRMVGGGIIDESESSEEE
jgi:hypothetical protein